MCGIAGFRGPAPLPEERAQACLALMRRRGPDSADWRQWSAPQGDHVALLHSRLSIIDLDERANQPFELDGLCAAYNGEAYNYREVGAELAARGRAFRTTSDTEVLLAGIREWGWDALDRLEGMWAFAVYDERDGSLVLCRDRFGEKPLYVYTDATGTYFGSEPKFIFALLGRTLPVDRAHVHRYLAHGYKALYKGASTFFEGLREVPRASYARVGVRGPEPHVRYWEPRFAPDEGMSYDEAVAGFRERFIRAVRLRLRSDVPLAFCMSGGIDSNALISVAKRVLDHDVHGFTIHDPDPRYDERKLVEQSAAELGIRHTFVEARHGPFLESLRELVRYHDAPVLTISYMVHWLLAGAIHDAGYKVSISGTGADEMLTGYYDHHLLFLHAVRGNKEAHAAALRAWRERIEPNVRNPLYRDPELFTRDPGFRGHVFDDAEALSRYLVRPSNEAFQEERFADDLLRGRMMNEMFHEIVPVILHEDDLNSMYYSIENRSPFLDRALYEFCLTIPTRHLIQDARTKAVLRDALAGVMPEVIRGNRRKVGFNASLRSLLDLSDPGVRERILSDSAIWSLVRRDRIVELLAKPTLSDSENKFLFYFLSAKTFLDEFSPEAAA